MSARLRYAAVLGAPGVRGLLIAAVWPLTSLVAGVAAGAAIGLARRATLTCSSAPEAQAQVQAQRPPALDHS